MKKKEKFIIIYNLFNLVLFNKIIIIRLLEKGKLIIKTLKNVPDFPKKGVNFKDIGPTFKDP